MADFNDQEEEENYWGVINQFADLMFAYGPRGVSKDFQTVMDSRIEFMKKDNPEIIIAQ